MTPPERRPIGYRRPDADLPADPLAGRHWGMYLIWAWLFIALPLMAGLGVGWWSLVPTVVVAAGGLGIEMISRRRIARDAAQRTDPS